MIESRADEWAWPKHTRLSLVCPVHSRLMLLRAAPRRVDAPVLMHPVLMLLR